MSVACRLLGHRFDFGADDDAVVWRCRRGCGAAGRHRAASPEAARHLAWRLRRGGPGPPTGLLAALAGTVPARGDPPAARARRGTRAPPPDHH